MNIKSKENIIEARDAVFGAGHLAFVLLTALFLLSISWMKNPEMFKFKREAEFSSVLANAPRYYAYVPPAEDRMPLVAGASTQAQGPSIINEDGSISQVIDEGMVLGLNTEDLKASLDSVELVLIDDSKSAIETYINDAQEVEENYINSLEIENALMAGTQEALDQQAAKVETIVDGLLRMKVPRSLEKMHKLKIMQYSSAVGLLRSYNQADSNPEFVSMGLSIFLQAQQELGMEYENLKTFLAKHE